MDYEPNDPGWEDFKNFPCPAYIRGNSYLNTTHYERDFKTRIHNERAVRYAECAVWLSLQVQVARKDNFKLELLKALQCAEDHERYQHGNSSVRCEITAKWLHEIQEFFPEGEHLPHSALTQSAFYKLPRILRRAALAKNERARRLREIEEGE